MKNMMTVTVKQERHTELKSASMIINSPKLIMLQNNHILFIHSSLDLLTEIYSTAGGQAAGEQNGFCRHWIQQVFTL